MACGESYEYLVQAAGGRSRAQPYDTTFGAQLWCNEPDAQAWYAQAGHVFRLQRSAWNRLMDLENAAQDWTQTRDIGVSASAYEAEYLDLQEPSFWMGFGAAGCADAVQSYISNIDTGKCVLERLNAALAARGSGVVQPGGAPPPAASSWGWVPWAVAGTAAVGVVGLGLWVRHQHRARAASSVPAYWAAPALPPGPALAAA